MEEIWKKVIGYEESYEVSNLGNVRSFDRYIKCKKNNEYFLFAKGYPIKQKISFYRYLCVSFKKNQKHAIKVVHKLVAEAFIPNLKNKPQVNHIDGDKLNNCVDNLEWVTASENCIHATKILRKKGMILTTEQVRDIKFNVVYDSMFNKDIASKFKVHPNTISSIRNGHKWKHVTQNPEDSIYFEEIIKKPARKLISIKDKETILRLKIEGFTNKKIGEIVGFSRSGISKFLSSSSQTTIPEAQE